MGLTLVLENRLNGGLDQSDRSRKHLKVVIERQSIAHLALPEVELEVVEVRL